MKNEAINCLAENACASIALRTQEEIIKEKLTKDEKRERPQMFSDTE